MTDPTDPSKRYRVQEIQKEPPLHDRSPGDEPPIPPPQLPKLLLAILLLLKDFLDKLLGRTPQSLETACRDHLLSLKEALLILQQENKSHDSAFLNLLSSHWQRLLEDDLRLGHSLLFAEKMRAFTREWQHYPQGAEHSLGYYLSEYAGQKWLPFPYMEMIAELHREHKEHPEQSSLSKWVKELETLSRMI
jgi:hypothetical protein